MYLQTELYSRCDRYPRNRMILPHHHHRLLHSAEQDIYLLFTISSSHIIHVDHMKWIWRSSIYDEKICWSVVWKIESKSCFFLKSIHSEVEILLKELKQQKKFKDFILMFTHNICMYLFESMTYPFLWFFKKYA